MSMDKHEAIPIDTHIWQIATKDYKLITGKTKTLTKANYTLISNHFRNLWGPYAGWAHSVSFTS
jgi:N-glycosylase/DNA lyase